MPEGVQVAVTTLDLSGPGFDSAIAKAQAFQAATSFSMRESTAAARLFNEEIGAGMSKHLTSVLSQSALLGPALQLAFPIAAAVGFYEVAEKIGTKLYDIFNDTAGLQRFGERMKAATDSIAKFHAETTKVMQEAAETGASPQQKFSMALDEATAKVTAQKKAVEDLSNKLYFLQNGMPITPKGGAYQDTANDITDVWKKKIEGEAQLGKLIADQVKAQAELKKAQSDAMGEYAKKAEEAAKAAKKHSEELDHQLATIQKMTDAIPLQHQPGQYWRSGYEAPRTNTPPWDQSPSNYGVAATEPSDAVTRKHLQDLQDQAGWYDATRTATEKYEAAVASLNALFVGPAARSSELYARSLKQIDDTLDPMTIKAAQAAEAQRKAWQQLNQQAMDSILNAAFMKESWSNAMKSILEDITRLIVKMYLLSAIQKKLNQDSSGGDSGGGGGFLGFMSNLFGGGSGSTPSGVPMDIGGAAAGGGSLSGGMSYLVGEKGPEIFTPGGSGFVTPNGKFGGGVTHVHNYDLRGADVGVEQRLLRLLPIVEDRAVKRSVATVQERDLRRPWGR